MNLDIIISFVSHFFRLGANQPIRLIMASSDRQVVAVKDDESEKQKASGTVELPKPDLSILACSPSAPEPLFDPEQSLLASTAHGGFDSYLIIASTQPKAGQHLLQLEGLGRGGATAPCCRYVHHTCARYSSLIGPFQEGRPM